jgi:hypothetical protein
MIVGIQLSRLRQTEWWEYLVRFAFGGVVTLLTGLIAKELGAVIGGLFLAFPGIFPAGVSLVERHERKKKERRGLSGERRGRAVAAATSAGAALGAAALLGFAAPAWRLLPHAGAPLVLVLATLGWLALAVLLWWLRRRV